MNFEKTHSTNQSGFTLVEIAIVFILVGFVFVPLIAVLVHIENDRNRVEDVDTNDRVAAALNLFLKQNGRYPCPADLNLGPGNANFGLEEFTGPGCNPANITLVGPVGAQVYIGAVPTQSLDLPYQQGINQEKWKLFYAVSQRLAEVGTYDGLGDIIVSNNFGSNSTGVHYVIVNPGPSGNRAFSVDGVQNATPAGLSLDLENTLDIADQIFLDAEPSIEIPQGNAAFYDDVLTFDHVSDKSDLWIVRQNMTGGNGQIEVTNRGLGNIGLGTEGVRTPGAKIDVEGNILVRGTAANTGQVKAIGNIAVTQTLIAQDLVAANNCTATDCYIVAERYCAANHVALIGTNNDAVCCEDNDIFFNWDGSRYDMTCANQAVDTCRNSNYLDRNGTCCAEANLDVDRIECTP